MILLLTHMITNQIGRYEVLLSLLISSAKSNVIFYSLLIFHLQPYRRLRGGVLSCRDGIFHLIAGFHKIVPIVDIYLELQILLLLRLII